MSHRDNLMEVYVKTRPAARLIHSQGRHKGLRKIEGHSHTSTSALTVMLKRKGGEKVEGRMVLVEWWKIRAWVASCIVKIKASKNMRDHYSFTSTLSH